MYSILPSAIEATINETKNTVNSVYFILKFKQTKYPVKSNTRVLTLNIAIQVFLNAFIRSG